MNENPTIDVQKVRPITRFIYTLGVLPTSYLMSMTYQEQLTWLCNYIGQTLIPAINNDVEAVQELQQLYIDLKNYVDNYFDNLDVQEEIDNKLDDMVEDGTLAKIINQEIFGEIQSDISDLQSFQTNATNNLETLNTNDLTELVVIGDSYTAMEGSNWANQVAAQLHLTLRKHATSSMGYVKQVDGQTFINRLNSEPENIRLKTKYLICYGGVNDRSMDKDDVKTAVKDFCTQAKTLYPNSRIIIVGPQKAASSSGGSVNLYLRNAIMEGALESGVSYANAQDWLMNNSNGYQAYYANDLLHPSATGFNLIASKMLSLICGNDNNNCFIAITPGESYSENSIIKCKVDSNKIHIWWRINNFELNSNSSTILGTFTQYGLATNQDPLTVLAYNSTNAYFSKVIGYTNFTGQGNIKTVNISGSNYSGTIIITGDIYLGMEEQTW